MAPERRPMSGKQGIEARNQQAARDALRRRQKAKKARTVKRHVRYKDRKKLLEEAIACETAAPIVAAELPRLGRDDSSDSEKAVQMLAKPADKKSTAAPTIAVSAEIVATDERAAADVRNETVEVVKENEELRESKSRADPKGNGKKKYTPFTKQIRQFQKVKREREEEEKKRQQRIKVRENMLKKSRKLRKNQSKQYRRVTTKGQPVLKHKLEAMLERIQKQ